VQPRITSAEVYDRWRRGEPVQFVDARMPEDFAASQVHLASSIRILPDQVDPHVVELSPHALIVVYCTSPGEQASDRVVERLHQLGWRSAVVLLGGFDASGADGLPLAYKPLPAAGAASFGFGGPA
jgi:rhodanese-related sulfurtransferase